MAGSRIRKPVLPPMPEEEESFQKSREAEMGAFRKGTVKKNSGDGGCFIQVSKRQMRSR